MSFVGPRPIRPRFFAELTEDLPAYWQRLVVRARPDRPRPGAPRLRDLDGREARPRPRMDRRPLRAALPPHARRDGPPRAASDVLAPPQAMRLAAAAVAAAALAARRRRARKRRRAPERAVRLQGRRAGARLARDLDLVREPLGRGGRRRPERPPPADARPQLRVRRALLRGRASVAAELHRSHLGRHAGRRRRRRAGRASPDARSASSSRRRRPGATRRACRRRAP